MSIKGILSGFGKMAIGANRVATGIAQAVGNTVAQHPWGELINKADPNKFAKSYEPSSKRYREGVAKFKEGKDELMNQFGK